MLATTWIKYCWPWFTLCTTATYVTEAVFLWKWLSVNTVEVLNTRAFGGKDKLNRIFKVSILFPYLLFNSAFSVRINQCRELKMIANACFGISDFSEKIIKGGWSSPILRRPILRPVATYNFPSVVQWLHTFVCIVWTTMLNWGSTSLGSSLRVQGGEGGWLGVALNGMVTGTHFFWDPGRYPLLCTI